MILKKLSGVATHNRLYFFQIKINHMLTLNACAFILELGEDVNSLLLTSTTVDP
jgi:hypothetical protein